MRIEAATGTITVRIGCAPRDLDLGHLGVEDRAYQHIEWLTTEFSGGTPTYAARGRAARG